MYLDLEKSPWIMIRDANQDAIEIFKRHYTFREYRDGRKRTKFIGPGEYICLITPKCDALFVWRKFMSMDNQSGINCSVFRNEGNQLSSYLILEAEKFARDRWPGERLYTYVNPKKIKSENPGYCFKMAGWVECGITKRNKLIILEKNP
jgi:hypothetical protein